MRKKQNSYCPIIIILSAICFNLVNGFINGYYFGNIAQYDNTYILNINFILGSIVFIIGIVINLISDNILLKIKNLNQGYNIPHNFLYNYISCPNYFGEIIEWFGFAIMTWSLPGLLFALWTIFNLVPRAISTHRWYKTQFENYPPNRKAIIPYII